jgi:flagellar hook assembly protein FlgD
MRRAAVIAVLATLACAGTAQAASRPTKQVKAGLILMPGVTYQRQVEFTPHGPVVYHVLTAPRPGGLYALRTVLSNGAVMGRERVTEMEKDVSTQATVAGVNGDLFNSNDGHPTGVLMRGGVLDVAPYADRSSIGIDSSGALHVDRIRYSGYWKGTGQRRALQLNAPVTPNTTTLYTSAWGPATPNESGPVVAETLSPFPPTTPNVDLTGPVASVAQLAGGVPIPPGSAVLIARGNQAQYLLAEALQGSQVLVHLTLTPSWAGITEALGGGPIIVRAGKPVFRANEAFDRTQLTPRDPRTAVGQLADGRVILVVVDGRQPGYSVGMTNFELALLLMRLGAVTASAVDSGGSSTMAFQGQLLNRPSDPGGERRVAEALLVEYLGVYVAAPALDVLSPNGDGVAELQTLAYKVVRPSTVSANLIGPDAVTRPIDAGQKQPGTYTFSWTGIKDDGTYEPEGRYQFVVGATDDQGQASSSTRTFQLDDTVGFLVSPSKVVMRKTGIALRGTYQLAHPATVTAQIATQSGVVLRTLFRGQLQPGQQSVTWDGRIGSGTLAFRGSYQLLVTATNALGTAALSQAFTAIRR